MTLGEDPNLCHDCYMNAGLAGSGTQLKRWHVNGHKGYVRDA